MFCSFGQPDQTCLGRAWVPRLLSGLYIHCLICVLTVWPLTSTSACFVTKQRLMMFGRQTFPVWTGLKEGVGLFRVPACDNMDQFYKSDNCGQMLLCSHIHDNLRLVHMEVADPGKLRYPA